MKSFKTIAILTLAAVGFAAAQAPAPSTTSAPKKEKKEKKAHKKHHHKKGADSAKTK